MHALFIAIVLLLAQATAIAQEMTPSWDTKELQNISSFSSAQKIVGTHYFYWYEYPDQHFFDNASQTDDGLQDHFVEPEKVSYRSAAWHKQEMSDCIDAGLDFILPVYWGAPDRYDRPGIAFSVLGLPHLQKAIAERTAEGLPSPKIGLFYDTSSLMPSIRGESGQKYDLKQDKGKDLFYRTIRDFFYQIKPEYWACIDGRPLVVLYGSGFAKDHDQSTFEYVYTQFANDFQGIRPYIIRDDSWRVTVDATTKWGSALTGPFIDGHVAQIGAGYNDMAVPGRSTPIRERENGNFYRWNWEKTLQSEAKIVIIETWNEMHEGTSICHSKEYGRQYIQLTADYVKKFKANQKGQDTITLKFPNPVHRPASDKGKEYKDASAVSIRLGAKTQEKGLWIIRDMPDGPVRNTKIANEDCTQTVEGANTYMYFSIADPFLFDTQNPVTLAVTFWDAGFSQLELQYDSHDPSATLNGAYKSSAPVLCTNTQTWKTLRIPIEDARFVNRQNGASDFRFAVHHGQLAIKEIVIQK
jgi:hypothetical protein